MVRLNAIGVNANVEIVKDAEDGTGSVYCSFIVIWLTTAIFCFGK